MSSADGVVEAGFGSASADRDIDPGATGDGIELPVFDEEHPFRAVDLCWDEVAHDEVPVGGFNQEPAPGSQDICDNLQDAEIVVLVLELAQGGEEAERDVEGFGKGERAQVGAARGRRRPSLAGAVRAASSMTGERSTPTAV